MATARRRRVRRRRSNVLPAASDGGAGVAEIERLSEAWDALADRAGGAPFLRPGWIAAWWRAFGRGRLEILTAGSGGKLDAVLPVVHRHGGIHAPSNWHTPQYGLLEAAEGAGSVLVADLFASAPQVSLGFVSSLTGEVRRFSDSAHAHRYSTLVRTQERSPLVVLDGDWESYEGRSEREPAARPAPLPAPAGRAWARVARRPRRRQPARRGARARAAGLEGAGRNRDRLASRDAAVLHRGRALGVGNAAGCG